MRKNFSSASFFLETYYSLSKPLSKNEDLGVRRYFSVCNLFSPVELYGKKCPGSLKTLPHLSTTNSTCFNGEDNSRFMSNSRYPSRVLESPPGVINSLDALTHLRTNSNSVISSFAVGSVEEPSLKPNSFSVRRFSSDRESLVKSWNDAHKKLKERLKRLQDEAERQNEIDSSSSFAPPSPAVPPSAMHQQSGVDLAGLPMLSEQPPPTQPLVGALQPKSLEERKLADLLARPDLMMTRKVEWANVIAGFEQQNRYVIMDPHKGLTVGFILERSNPLLRQFLRARRYFQATFYNALGEELCVVRRPFYWISSSLTVEIGGKVVGKVLQRWHLWRRNYDVYIKSDEAMRQFGEVSNPGFWWWTFTVKDENGNPLAEIDRSWRGLGFEFFTDAGQYFVRFGDVSVDGNASKAPPPSSISTTAGVPLNHANLEEMTRAAEQIPPFEVERPLSLEERAVVLGLAMSLDNDFFSRHSGEAGILPWGLLAAGE